MSGTFTTDYQNVDDGETVTIDPQQIIPKSGYLDINKAQIQFRGESDFFTNTITGNRFNSDSGEARIVSNTFTDRNSNTGSTSLVDNRKTVTESKEKINFDSSDNVLGKPNLKKDINGSIASPSAPSIPDDAKNISVTLKYFVNETVGRSDDNITIRYDDDPGFGSFDDLQENISISGNQRLQVFERTFNNIKDFSYEKFDGGEAKISSYETADPGDRISVRAEAIFKVEYEVESQEGSFQTLQETVSTSFPSPTGKNVKEYRVQVLRNGSRTENFQVSQGGDLPGDISRTTGQSDNDTVTVICITRSEERFLQQPTLSVQYPFVESGFSFDNHDIHRDGYGDDFNVIFDNREGETKVEKPDIGPNDGRVELELETEYSKTVTRSDDSVNPTVKEEYLEEGFNTDNVLLVIDKSQSMGDSNRNSIVKDIVDSLPDSTSLSILSFNFTADLLLNDTKLLNNRGEVNSIIESLPAEGGTDISEAIRTVEESIIGDNNSGTVVLITDGNNFRDVEDIELPSISSTFDFLSIGVTNDVNNEFLTDFSSFLDGEFIEGPITDTVVSTRLNDGEITSFTELEGFTSGKQDLTFSIEESEEVEFRLRFDWEIESPEPILGTVGFYDESTSTWKETAVTSPDSNSLEYNHVSVYNEELDEWGALDVVDLSHPVAITAFQFYDEDEGWLAPRKYETQSE